MRVITINETVHDRVLSPTIIKSYVILLDVLLIIRCGMVEDFFI